MEEKERAAALAKNARWLTTQTVQTQQESAIQTDHAEDKQEKSETKIAPESRRKNRLQRKPCKKQK